MREKSRQEEGIALGIPGNPDQSYTDHGWKIWLTFLGKKPLSYNECAKIVQTKFDFDSKPEFLEWSTANSNLRKNLGIPSTPSQDYK